MALVQRILLFALSDIEFHPFYVFGTKKVTKVGFVSADERCMKLVFPTSIQFVISVTENLNVVVYEPFLWFSFKNRTLQEQFNGVERKE
jgi:hypothetical protein